ncbi:tyrosine-type recombinase/integrase [Pseudomonas fragi]|uniref:tyrosine-type recombinase/integrase n=1 Tax=Pseudomonas fragi TaxID=296 RepID=UPI0010550414|nr:tyrosine-type recombinase/integrase [Pseudomonas fragi]
MPANERPTFHEIRALGAWLYEQQGFAQDDIQGLMGHADVKMTAHYHSGHGPEAVIYHKVKADLKLLPLVVCPMIGQSFPNREQQKRAHLSVSPSRPPSRADFVW